MKLTIPRGKWKPFGAQQHPKPEHAILAVMTCPGCGKDFSIGRKAHSIASDGTVMPSMVCPFPPCTFHEFVSLEGWGA